MNTQKIEPSALPGLESGQGLYGSAVQSGVAYEDGIVAIMVYVYDNGAV